MCNDNIQAHIIKEDLSKSYFDSVVRTLEAASSIILFGAGQGGVRTYEFLRQYDLHLRVACFLDNNPRKQGRKMLNADIISLEDFICLNLENYVIVVSCGEGDEIENQCLDAGIPKENILIPDLTLVNLSGTADSDFRFIWDHVLEFNSLYELLDDALSRQTLINILNYKISRDKSFLKQICDDPNNQYFDKKLIAFSGAEIFVDCGAYTADTIENLLNKFDFTGGIVHCFEPDKENYLVLTQNLSKMEKAGNIKAYSYNAAVWNQVDTLYFHAIGSGSGFVDPYGEEKVSAVSLDQTLKGQKVDFIKMDIEGAEINALIGAYQLIQKNRPTLAISVYHKPEHLFQIPFLMKAITSDYRLYLRHYRKYAVSETVCYGVPGERILG